MDMEKIDQLLYDASRKIHNEAEAKRQADAKEVYSRMEKIDFKLIEKLLSIRKKIVDMGMEEYVKKKFSGNIPTELLYDISWNCDPTYHTFGYFPDSSCMGILSRGLLMPGTHTLQYDFCSSGLYLEAHYRWMKDDLDRDEHRDEYPAYLFRTERGVMDALIDTYPDGGIRIGKDILLDIKHRFECVRLFNELLEKTLENL